MNPKYGIALAPDFKVGGLCFLEFDQRPWLAEWAAEEGQPKPRTRLHKSGGKQAPHYLFTHTEKSLELGNTNGVRNGQEHFSFRADRRYVVAPPTIHESGRPRSRSMICRPPEQFDTALLGWTHGFGAKPDSGSVAVYSREKLVEILAAEFAEDDAYDGDRDHTDLLADKS